MMIFWQPRLVMLANTKTGSTSLMAALGDKADVLYRNPPGLKHGHLYRFQKFVKPSLDRVEDIEWEFFSVMREPLDWLGSWYRYRRRPQITGKPKSTSGISFDHFVQDHLSERPSEFSIVGNQLEFFEPMKGTNPVHHIFAYEHQDKIHAFLENRLKTSLTTPRLNVSKPADLTLGDETKARFLERYAGENALYAAVRQRD